MPNYENGKIYKIVGDDGSTYYGSTSCSLKDRMRKHLYDKGTSAYKKIISQMEYEIILVENYPCESKKELELREGWYIRENPCVNRCIAGRTTKEYYADHREKILKIREVYYVENREEIIEYSKKLYQDKREQKLAYAKIRDTWMCSFGDPRNSNCVQRCDYMLFQ